MLGILHDLEKFHLYCFGHEVGVITDHKFLVALFKKDVAIFKVYYCGYTSATKIPYKAGP